MRGFNSPSLLVRAVSKALAVTVAGFCLGAAAMLQWPIHYLFLLVILAPLPWFKGIWKEHKLEQARRRQKFRARIDAKYGAD